MKGPGIERREAKHLDAGAVAAVLRAAQTSRYHSALVLIASTGLRRGECLALPWHRVDLDAGTLNVATLGRIGNRLVISVPKTDRSRRTVPLSPAVVALLRKHKARQAAERLRAASQWHDCGLVFTTELGAPVDPRNLLRTVEVAAKAAGVEGVGVHTLRHSAAVAWPERGAHFKAVADLLGHSSIAITGDVYGHTSDDAAPGRGRRPERSAWAMKRAFERKRQWVAVSVAVHTPVRYPNRGGRGPPLGPSTCMFSGRADRI